MSLPISIAFVSLSAVKSPPSQGVSEQKDSKDFTRPNVLVILAGENLAMGQATQKQVEPALAAIQQAACAQKFKGKLGGALEILAPHGLGFDRLLILGCAQATVDASQKETDPKASEGVKLGGIAMGKIGEGVSATIFADTPEGANATLANGADIALGAILRAYKFDRYFTKKKDETEPKAEPSDIVIALADPASAQNDFAATAALAEGVVIARDLVNEPPNVLFPIEFANRAKKLEQLGVTVEILDKKALAELGMGALLGVGQGSAQESRVVIMRWNGGAADEQPIAFVGKGVCFDSGGISIKPAASMEDMKGDMAGAACVVGLMHALAGRKAAVNAIGAIGLVENMPDGAAQRPGDIVTSLSGQTIEIINTDAEGRLVLADVLWYVQDKYKPRFIIDLATLTGAILVALGDQFAGLFSNNDELSANIARAGLATGELVWRMPLTPAFDKMIDSKFADMKNTGGRYGGSITAAQFLQRYVNKTPWAHLDIAGTGMGSPASDINQSWASGWGVRLLDQLVRDNYEAKKLS